LRIGQRQLSLTEIEQVSRHHRVVRIDPAPEVEARVRASCRYIDTELARGAAIYGVTTGFGGMANVSIPVRDADDLQNNMLFFLKAGAGRRLPLADVRAAMLLRARSHLHGHSGLRLELIQRLVIFLNARVTPHVPEFGSIGASGDLIPLTYITGAIAGADGGYTVDFDGTEMPALKALERLGLPRLPLKAKEGLAMLNGTSVMTGIAALCVQDCRRLLAVSLGIHALLAQGLEVAAQAFHPFIHDLKPHPGQRWTAQQMVTLLQGSGLVRQECRGGQQCTEGALIQDRYSLRCLPQYLGPIVDGLREIASQIETEANSATDNPLVDAEHGEIYHGGNFLGQYVGMGMDRLRYLLGLLIKHLDVQIALTTSPAFSNGLAGSLVGNPDRRVNMGLKGLQIAANSIMPIVGFLGNSIADRFPTHAEQFNQNINSQGFASANLARQSIDAATQYLAIALIFAVQAVDLRTHRRTGCFDAAEQLSPSSLALYEAVRAIIGRPRNPQRPLIWNDDEQCLDACIAALSADLSAGGRIAGSVQSMLEELVHG
jgi:phenylalanine ammonia-lyase